MTVTWWKGCLFGAAFALFVLFATIAQSTVRTSGAHVLAGLTMWSGGTAGRVLFVGASKELDDDAGFTYDQAGDTVTLGTQVVANGSGTAFNAPNGLFGSSKSGGDAFRAPSSDLGDILGGHRQTITGWVRDNVAASLTNSALSRFATAAVQLQWTAPRAGSVLSVGSVWTVATAGAAPTISVFKNGSLLVAHNPGLGLLANVQTYAKDAQVFAANDELDIRITTTAGWTAVTSDLVVDLEVEF